MATDDSLLGGLMQVIGTPNNFAGEVVLYSIAGGFFICLGMLIFVFGFRVLNRW